MWRTMQAEPSTSVPYMAHDAVKVLNQLKYELELFHQYGENSLTKAEPFEVDFES